MYDVKRIGLIVLLSVLSFCAAGESLEGYRVMALSPHDERAVVKTPEGGMSVLKPGDVIEGTRATVKQVLTDKLVLDEKVKRGGGAGEIETVWLYKIVDGTSRIERLHKRPPGQGDKGSVIQMQIESTVK